MRRPRPQSQLELPTPEAMRWEHLPAPVRERVRAQLVALLQQAAAPPPERANEE
jgi:hypothetical protein